MLFKIAPSLQEEAFQRFLKTGEYVFTCYKFIWHTVGIPAWEVDCQDKLLATDIHYCRRVKSKLVLGRPATSGGRWWVATQFCYNLIYCPMQTRKLSHTRTWTRTRRHADRQIIAAFSQSFELLFVQPSLDEPGEVHWLRSVDCSIFFMLGFQSSWRITSPPHPLTAINNGHSGKTRPKRGNWKLSLAASGVKTRRNVFFSCAGFRQWCHRSSLSRKKVWMDPYGSRNTHKGKGMKGGYFRCLYSEWD